MKRMISHLISKKYRLDQEFLLHANYSLSSISFDYHSFRWFHFKSTLNSLSNVARRKKYRSLYEHYIICRKIQKLSGKWNKITKVIVNVSKKKKVGKLLKKLELLITDFDLEMYVKILNNFSLNIYLLLDFSFRNINKNINYLFYYILIIF